MRGEDEKQSAMFSYVTLERRVPPDHPLRAIRGMADRALERMDGDRDKLYAATGRSSIAPERRLRALLVMVLYSIRSERQLMEQLEYNLLYRWFVGLEMDDAVWDVTVFTKNRERLIAGEVSQQMLQAVLVEAREKELLSAEHFTVDGTLIQAWAAARSFTEKSDPPKPGAGSGYQGEVLWRDKVESKTDPEARLYKKATADKSVPSYQGHALMENRHGLVVVAERQPVGHGGRARGGAPVAGPGDRSPGQARAEAGDHAGSRHAVSGGKVYSGATRARGGAACQRVCRGQSG